MSASLQRTPLYSAHRALGARLVPFAGFEMPVQYAGIVKEHTAVREHAGLFDVSHMGELFLRGPRAVSVADELVTNAVSLLPVGKALYTACCNEQGFILDDLIVYRRGEEEILIVCNASNHDKISKHVREHAQGRCDFEDATDATALIALQGPQAAAVLSAAKGESLASLEYFWTAAGTVAGVECNAARTGYTGEDGFEIFCKNADAPAIWDALLAAGRDMGIAPVGLGARDTLRLEAKLCLYGNDIDESTHPFEAGLAWVVKLEHNDFVGRDRLAEIKAAGLTRKLIGFEMAGRKAGRHGHSIVDPNGEAIGVVTSGGPSPTLGKSIGLGYVPKAMAKRGTTLSIEIRDKAFEARVVKTPFYKRAK